MKLYIDTIKPCTHGTWFINDQLECTQEELIALIKAHNGHIRNHVNVSMVKEVNND